HVFAQLFPERQHRGRGRLGALLVNCGLEIIFNGLFDVHISARKRAKSRILRRRKTTAVSIYHARINQSAAPMENAAPFTLSLPLARASSGAADGARRPAYGIIDNSRTKGHEMRNRLRTADFAPAGRNLA